MRRSLASRPHRMLPPGRCAPCPRLRVARLRRRYPPSRPRPRRPHRPRRTLPPPGLRALPWRLRRASAPPSRPRPRRPLRPRRTLPPPDLRVLPQCLLRPRRVPPPPDLRALPRRPRHASAPSPRRRRALPVPHLAPPQRSRPPARTGHTPACCWTRASRFPWTGQSCWDAHPRPCRPATCPSPSTIRRVPCRAPTCGSRRPPAAFPSLT